MFERFTDRARLAVVLAQREARALDHQSIGTEDLLLGLTQLGQGTAIATLKALGVPLEAARTRVLEGVLASATDPSPVHLPFTPAAKAALELATQEADSLQHDFVGTGHILLALLRQSGEVAHEALESLGVSYAATRREVVILSIAEPGDGPPPSPDLAPFGKNLTEDAREGRLSPVVGREQEIDRVLQVLSRRTRNAPVLVGEPGVGKTSVVEGLAHRIVNEEVPPQLQGMQVYRVDRESLGAPHQGTTSPTDILRTMRSGVRQAATAILFIDDPFLLRRDESNSNELVSLVRQIVKEDVVPVIAAMTVDDYHAYVRTDTDVADRFEPITVEEPSVAEVIEILRAKRDTYEQHHHVSISDSAITLTAELAHLYTRESSLPQSAFGLLDEAGARLRTTRASLPPDLRALDAEIASVRAAKEEAIDGQSFERASELRDSEKRLLSERAKGDARWRAVVLHYVPDVDEDLIAQVVANATGISEAALSATRQAPREFDTPPEDRLKKYCLLGDQPVTDVHDDLLGTRETAAQIAAILTASTQSTPLVVAIDGGWGVGKSTLLGLIQAELPDPPQMITVRFNAWTAEGDNALEGLIKSVLFQLDANRIRRLVNQLAQRRGLVRFSKLVIALVAKFVGVSRLVDDLWDQAGTDAQTRNEFRAAVREALGEWANRDGSRDEQRTLVAFVDDLDRCSDEVVVQICEAVKLYLDAPGIIFVLACDMSVLARGVSASARGGEGEGRTYLEKIVQVALRISAPTSEQTEELIMGYAKASGTDWLIDQTLVNVLAEGAARNPRRIKRVLNSFVMEHHLNPAWQQPPLGSQQLITSVLLQHLYPAFYDRLAGVGVGDDPIAEFLDYVEVKKRELDPPGANSAWWSVVGKTFRRQGMAAPDRFSNDATRLSHSIEALERRLPPEFPALVRDDSFVALLRGVGNVTTRVALRAQLLSRPLRAEVQLESVPLPRAESAGQ